MTTLLSCTTGIFGTRDFDVPREIDGWVLDTEMRQFNRKTLFKYIDGGAELYLAYSFQNAYAHTYIKPGKPNILLDLYDMSTPEDAFGLFTSEREGDDIGIGDVSEYDGGLLRFYKGRFFVSIMAYQETSESKQAVLSLGKAVADGIPSLGQKPELLSYLPRTALIERTIRYFHDHNILNLHYYVADENILLLDAHTEAVLATYDVEGDKPYLLIVKYPTTHHARRASQNFLKVYIPDAMEAGIVQTENEKWTAVASPSRFVTIVFDGPTETWARSLLETVGMRLE